MNKKVILFLVTFAIIGLIVGICLGYLLYETSPLYLSRGEMKFSTKYITGVDFIRDELLSEVFEDGYNRFGLKVCDYTINIITVIKWSNGNYNVITNNPSNKNRNRLNSIPYVIGDMPAEFSEFATSVYTGINTPKTDWSRPSIYITTSPHIEFYFRRFDGKYYTRACIPPDRDENRNRTMHGVSAYRDNQKVVWIESVMYYRPKIFTPEVWRSDNVIEREVHSRAILDKAIERAAKLEPDVEDFGSPIDLQIVDNKDVDYNGAVGKNDAGQWIIWLNDYYLASSSDLELYQLFGHELGHIARPSDKSWGDMSKEERQPWQDAADAFAMKLLDYLDYYDFLLGACCMSREEVGNRMGFLHDINEKFNESE